jgi:hypothetical protein
VAVVVAVVVVVVAAAVALVVVAVAAVAAALVATRSQQRLKTVVLVAEMGKGSNGSSGGCSCWSNDDLQKTRKFYRATEKIRVKEILERLSTVVLAQPDYGQLSKFKKDKELKKELEGIFVDAASVTTACNPFNLRVPLG